MALNKRSTLPYRRKREGRTDYRKRLRLLSSHEIRMVVRMSERNVLAQLVAYTPEGDRVLVSASSKELEKRGWRASRSNLPCAYLVGLLLAKKAAKAKKPVRRAILDLGVMQPIAGSRVYAVLAGAVDGGLEVPYSEGVLPGEERIRGKHIKDYATLLKKDEKRYQRQFSAYLKDGIDPAAFTDYFNKFKEKIMKE